MDDSRIIKTEYSEEMQKSFIDYAMSVIIARALPVVRPVLFRGGKAADRDERLFNEKSCRYRYGRGFPARKRR